MAKTPRTKGAASAPATAPAPSAAHVHPWVAVITVVVSILGSSVPVAIYLNNRIDSTKTDAVGLGTRLDKLDAAVKALSSQQTDQTQKLIHELLATAQSTSIPGLSAKATLTAASLTSSLQTQRKPASPEFFMSAIDILNTVSPRVETEAINARLALANYRSSLQVAPSNPVPAQTTITFTGPPGSGMLPLGGGSMSNMNLVALHGASQTLDTITWTNVTFVGAHIVYRGGPVTLVNVLFVNCTFEVPTTKRRIPEAQQLLDYAALAQSTLSVGI